MKCSRVKKWFHSHQLSQARTNTHGVPGSIKLLSPRGGIAILEFHSHRINFFQINSETIILGQIWILEGLLGAT